jgi:hypothetical protein
MITFVTAFLCGDTAKHTPESYRGWFDRLAGTGVPIVLFLDPKTEWTSFPSNVRVIPACLRDTWVGHNVPIDAVLPAKRGEKDTLEYMMIQNTKPEFVARASQLNPYGTEWFAWVDFGIGHVFKTPETTLDRIQHMVPPTTPCMRTAGIWNHVPDSTFDDVCWRYAGGFFLIHSSLVSRFHDAVIAAIQRKLPRIAWEVNVWAEVERSGMNLGWFSADHDDRIIPSLPSNWTVVTAYFDLTRMPDASPSIKARSAAHYLASASATMNLDQNLVVFCEPDMVDTLRSIRPEYLHEKTRFIPISFEDFPLTKHRSQIIENRKIRPPTDDRNTASYYLLCMARYAMLKRVIEENTFGSTHFAWLNICIERMGPKNVEQLPRVFEINRDKFSTCYIDYQRKEDYLENVMRWGRCSMCSGFFTGNAHYMKTFCDRIEEAFLECLANGYGHADEQLYSLVYFDDPSIFDVYYGDYTEMVTNYEWIRDHPNKPLYLLIKHSYESGDKATCLNGCLALWRSWKKGYAKLSEQEVTHLIWYYEHCLPQPRELE